MTQTMMHTLAQSIRLTMRASMMHALIRYIPNDPADALSLDEYIDESDRSAFHALDNAADDIHDCLSECMLELFAPYSLIDPEPIASATDRFPDTNSLNYSKTSQSLIDACADECELMLDSMLNLILA